MCLELEAKRLAASRKRYQKLEFQTLKDSTNTDGLSYENPPWAQEVLFERQGPPPPPSS